MHEKCLKKCIKLIVPEIVLKIGNAFILETKGQSLES